MELHAAEHRQQVEALRNANLSHQKQIKLICTWLRNCRQPSFHPTTQRKCMLWETCSQELHSGRKQIAISCYKEVVIFHAARAEINFDCGWQETVILREQSASHLGQSCRSGQRNQKAFVIWQTSPFEIALSNCQFSDDSFLNLLIISRSVLVEPSYTSRTTVSSQCRLQIFFFLWITSQCIFRRCRVSRLIWYGTGPEICKHSSSVTNGSSIRSRLKTGMHLNVLDSWTMDFSNFA